MDSSHGLEELEHNVVPGDGRRFEKELEGTRSKGLPSYPSYHKTVIY